MFIKKMKNLKLNRLKKSLFKNSLLHSLSLNSRPYTTGFDEDPTINRGTKREKSALKESGHDATASILNATQQGLTASTSLTKVGYKGTRGEANIEKFRGKMTPLGTRLDPLYGTGSLNFGKFKGTVEGSPLGTSASLFSILFGPMSPYFKATLGYQGKKRKYDISTGYPFLNITPNEPDTPQSLESVPPVVSEEQAISTSKSKQPSPYEESQMEEEIAKLKELYELHHDFDPLTRL